MSLPGLDLASPDLGRSILGASRRPEEDTGPPIANERRSRSQSINSAEQAEQVRQQIEEEEREDMEGSNQMPYIDDSVRRIVMSQAQPLNHNGVNGSYRTGRTPTGPSRGRGGHRFQRISNASDTVAGPSGIDRKRKNGPSNRGSANKRPRNSMPGRLDHGNHWILDNQPRHPPSDAPRGPRVAVKDPYEEDYVPRGREGQSAPRNNDRLLRSSMNWRNYEAQDQSQEEHFEHMHPERMERHIDHAENTVPAVHASARPNAQFPDQSRDDSRRGAVGEPSGPESSRAAGFMSALRGSNITAEEFTTATTHGTHNRPAREVETAGAIDEVGVKHEGLNEDDLSVQRTEEVAQTEQIDNILVNRSVAPENSSAQAFQYLQGMTLEQQVHKLKTVIDQMRRSKERNMARSAQDRERMEQQEDELRTLRERMQETLEAKVEAERALKSATKEKKAAEKAKKVAEQASKDAEKAKGKAEKATRQAVEKADHLTKRNETLSNEFTLVTAEKGNKDMLAKFSEESKEKDELLAKRDETIRLKDEEIQNLNDKLIKKSSIIANNENALEELSKQIQKYETTLQKKDQLIEKHLATLQKNTQDIEKLRKQLADSETSSSKNASADDASSSSTKQLVKNHKKELKEAQKLLEVEQLEKRELKKKFNAKKEELSRLEAVLEHEQKSRRGVEKQLAHAQETKGQLKERLKKATGDEESDDEADSDSTSSSDESSGDESSGGDNSDGQPQQRNVSKSKTPRIKTENRRSSSAGSQKNGQKRKKAGGKKGKR